MRTIRVGTECSLTIRAACTSSSMAKSGRALLSFPGPAKEQTARRSSIEFGSCASALTEWSKFGRSRLTMGRLGPPSSAANTRERNRKNGVREMTGRYRWCAAWAVALALVSGCHAEDAHDSSAAAVTLMSGRLQGVRFGDDRNGVAFPRCALCHATNGRAALEATRAFRPVGRHARRYAVWGGMSAASRALAELPSLERRLPLPECLDQANVGPAQAARSRLFSWRLQSCRLQPARSARAIAFAFGPGGGERQLSPWTARVSRSPGTYRRIRACLF